MSFESVMPSNHLIHPLLPPSPLALNLSQHQGLFSFCIRWPKYWSFTFSISPSREYSGLISFRIDSFVLLAVQGTLKSLLQHHSSKASIHWVLYLQVSDFQRCGCVFLQGQAWVTLQLAFHLLLLMILQLCHLHLPPSSSPSCSLNASLCVPTLVKALNYKI